MPGIAETERRARDLRTQVAELEPGLAGEVMFEHIRTRRGLVTVYSMTDGEALPIPEYMVRAVMTKVVDGEYMFTDNPDEAPTYRQGTVKCFMHAESSERATGVLDEIGLAGKVCIAGSLANVHSKRIHGERRHGREWAAYQEFLNDRKEEKAIARQVEQLDATLAIARGGTAVADRPKTGIAAPSTRIARGECDICGKTGLKRVQAHKSMVHKEA